MFIVSVFDASRTYIIFLTFIVNDDIIVAETKLAHHQSPPAVSWSVRNTKKYTGVGRKVIILIFIITY